MCGIKKPSTRRGGLSDKKRVSVLRVRGWRRDADLHRALGAVDGVSDRLLKIRHWVLHELYDRIGPKISNNTVCCQSMTFNSRHRAWMLAQ